jgi:hypothetical protein
MLRRCCSLLFALALLGTLAARAAPALAGPPSRTFPETGHTLTGAFLAYWESHGGLDRQGYPLSDEIQAVSPLDGRPYTVQYFERAVFELHPENAGTPFAVLLAQLGTVELRARYPGGPPPSAANPRNPRSFPETGHTLGGAFRAYWEGQGGLAQFGYPLTDEFAEVSALDSQPRTVQYFERAVFEYHPENAGTAYEVALAQLGRYQLARQGGGPAAAPVAPAAAPNPVARPFHAGITVPDWTVNGYSTPASDATWPALATLGAKWVAVVPTWFQANAGASQIAPESSGRSASEAAVRQAVARAHAAGLRVLLKPHVDSQDGTWRGQFRPADAAAWFASYSAFMTTWAWVAQESGVDLLAVGTELVELTGPAHTADWTRIVGQVRGVYHGPLTYAANWGKQAAEYEQIAWWDQMDYIGIDAYFPLSTKAAPTVDDLQAGWTSYTDPWGQTYHWKAAISAVQQRWNRPVLFTEVGYASTPAGPAAWDGPGLNGGGPADLAVQAAAYHALFATWGNVPWFAGFYAWQWSINPAQGGPNDASLFVNGKPPVLDVLRTGFTSNQR